MPDEFFINPIKYIFEKFEVNRIFMIVGGRTREEVKTRSLSMKGNETKVNYDGDMKVELPDGVKKTEWNDYIKKNKLIVLSHNGRIIIRDKWIFKFLNHQVDNRALELFERCISCVLNCRNNWIYGLDLERAIRDKQIRKCLKMCYECVFGDMNLTSLVRCMAQKVQLDTMSA